MNDVLSRYVGITRVSFAECEQCTMLHVRTNQKHTAVANSTMELQPLHIGTGNLTDLLDLPVLDLELLHNWFGCAKTPQYSCIREDAVANAGFLVHLSGSSKHVLVVGLDYVVKHTEIDHSILCCKNHYYSEIAY